MYSIDLNNIVPHKDLTCLVAKASADECILWHRRLGHLNVKTMNKLVRHNLVRGLPTKYFDNDHTCTACLKGKQHKASCKSKLVNSVTKPLHTLHMDLFGPTSDQDFDALPSEEDIVSFLRELSHTRVVNSINNVVIDQMHQPWRTFVALINKSLSGKTTALDKLRLSRAHMLWGMDYQKNVDYVDLLWEEITYQMDNRGYKNQEKIYYPRFTKVIIHHFLIQEKTLSWRNKIRIPQMKESKAYKTYLGYAIGTVPPKVATKFKKASPSKKDSVPVQVDEEPVQKGKRVKRSTKKSLTTPATGIVIREPPVETQSKRKEKVDVARGKGIDLFFKVDLTEEALMKEIRKKSLRDFHKSHPSGSGSVVKKSSSVKKITPPDTNKGIGDKPGVPDVTKDDSTKSESESWGNDDDDRNDEEGSEQENNSEEHESDFEQDIDGSESDSKFDQQDDNDDDEVKDDGNDDDHLKEKENLEITQEQVIEDDHVKITKKSEVPVTSSSCSSDLASIFINFSHILHEVIKFGDSYVVPANTTTTDTTSGEKSGRTVTLTAEDMQRKKNDVKARTTLLLSLLDEHQLSDLDTMSLDDLYNHLKVYESEVQKKSEPNSQNMAFISSAKHISRNEDGNTVCVPTASNNVPTASASVATICQDTACAYIASQSSDKFWKKTGKKISIQGSDVVGFDKSKVECFNCHKMGHFVRECRAPRSQDGERRDNYRQGSKAEEQTPKALMAIDRVGWDWSYMANDEKDHALFADKVAPTKFALMANTSAESKVFNNFLCSNDCKKSNDSLNSKITDLTDKLFDANNYIYHYKLALAQVESRLVEYKEREVKYIEKIRTLEFYNKSNKEFIETLKKKLETLKQENEGVDGKLAGLLTASKDLDNLVKSQRSDKNKEGLGYTTVPHPPVQLYLSPKKDLSWTGLLKCADDTITDYSRPLPTVESNISYLSDYEPFDGGYVFLVKEDARLQGKGQSKLNSVLFTDSKCIVLGRDFKLLDDANILLRTPRQHNMYSIILDNIVPHRDLTCLVAKASADERMLWHRRLGHLNFKTMNKLVRHNLVRGLPTKCFENDHTCTACLKGKQHKASSRTMLADAKLPVTFWTEAVNTACYVQNKVLVNKSYNKTPYELFNGRPPAIGFLKPFGCYVMILNTLENLEKFKEKGDEGTKDATSQEVKKDVSSLRYIALPNWDHDALLEFSSSKPQDHCSTEVPKGSGNPNPTNSTSNPLADQMETLTVETPIPTVSSPVPTAYSTDSQEPSSDASLISKRVANQEETPSLNNILSLTNRFEDIHRGTTNSDESNGEEADISNIEIAITASPTPTLGIHKDHPKSQIIGPMDTPFQTRNKSKEVGEQSFIATIHQKTDPALL
nr:hypothetical protein [Tanacetum cinerariifolium]